MHTLRSEIFINFNHGNSVTALVKEIEKFFYYNANSFLLILQYFIYIKNINSNSLYTDETFYIIYL